MDVESRIEGLLARMTLEEKAALTAGSDAWHGVAIPRLGIPRLKVTDGPTGARGESPGAGPTAACFPNGSALAATWDPDRIERVGEALAEEARSKGAHVLLGPTVNMHRSPLGGRHFECYAEDPHLAARIAAAFVRGVQRRGVGTSVKHFVANDSEFERHTISSEVDERALREIYLPPFEAAVREAGAWTVMGAYNRIGGTYACEHRALLRDLLKEEWGFDGLVVSDWGAVHTTAETAVGGCDLEMPGPARHLGPKLAKAVQAGEVPEAVLDDMARRILRVMARTGALDAREEPEERAEDRPAHRALIRETACSAAVLLKNERGVLPLHRPALRRLALVGPNARDTCIQGGGSALVRAHREVSVLDALRERAEGRFELVFEPGCTSHRSVPVVRAEELAPPEGEGPGLELAFFASADLSGEPVRTRTTGTFERVWIGSPGEGLPDLFSARLRGRFVARESGTHTFALTVAGKGRLFLEGELAIDQWEAPERGEAFFGLGSTERTAEIPLREGDAVELVLEYSKEGAPFVGGLKLGHLPPLPADMMERAETAAREADAAVVVIGSNREWETEGHDRESLALPGRQAELARRVAAVNPNTVVVVNAGAPVDLAFADAVPALLWAWYPGQEAGHAVADLLFGDAEPGGRLPTTFPVRLEDTPSFPWYPGADGEVVYGEGVFAGYRHYDTKGVTPRFPFGFGLSYTRFALSELTLSRTEAREDELPLEASVEVRNVGDRPGSEVVQLYVHDPEASVPRPEQELRAFAKVALAPGERRRVTLALDARAFAFWHPERRRWVAEPGDYEIRVGRSSRDLPLRARFRLGD